MDKVLIIDTHNAVYRANITFGPKIQHAVCINCDNKKHNISIIHCKCGAPYHKDDIDEFCYHIKYGIVYNFFRNLRALVDIFRPDACFFALEGHPEFRYKLYPQYKANRIVKLASDTSDTKKKISEAANLILNLLSFLPVSFAKSAVHEADDVIYTLCKHLKNDNVTVISNDSDYIQLLQCDFAKVQIYNPFKKSFMVAPPYPYVAWKALAGDSSDNIPGLIKPKQATALVRNPADFQKFMSIEENRANFSINKELISFKMINENELSIKDGSKNPTMLKQAFIDMKFNSLTDKEGWNNFINTFNCLKY